MITSPSVRVVSDYGDDGEAVLQTMEKEGSL